MLCLLTLIVIPVVLASVGYPQGLPDLTVSSPKLRVHVGESALMGCVVQSTEEKPVDKVDWVFSKGEHAESEYVLYYYSSLSVPTGRFQNRSRLVGDLLRNDGSLLLQDVQKADEGIYTCEIRLKNEGSVSKKFVLLHVLPEEPKELRVHVGDPIQMGCFFQSTEERRVTKVNWMFSSGKHAQEEIVLSYDFNMHSGTFQGQGRFRNRVDLTGDISRNDGSIMLQTVKKSDQGVYTCSIYLGELESRKTIVLHVIQDESPRSISTTTETAGKQQGILDGNQLVIIVGIICATLLLLPVLILIVKKTKWNKSTQFGVLPPKHPVWPSLQPESSNAVEKKSQLGEFPKQSKLSEMKGETLHGRPWGHCASHFRLVLSSWSLLHQRPGDRGSGIQRKTELLQITKLCGLLEVVCWLARMGSSLIYPVLSSTPLDWICNMNSGLLVCSCGMSY